ncbi:MAG TPA: tautomerase family protein [Azonexus sp.]
MPLIQITVAGPTLPPDAIRSLQHETTRLMHEVLHKEAALTVVAVSQLPATAASAGGEPVEAVWLQAQITAGTNTLGEKAAFIAAAEAMLVATLGAPAAPTYVVLHEVPATDWGYDGLSQAARRQAHAARVAA